MCWVGIDVSKATLDVVLVRDQDRQSTQMSNDKAGWRTLERFLKKRCAQTAHVCLEATGLYGDGVAAFLHAQGYRVSVVNPARIKAYGDSQLNRNKTDRADAALIADFCRTQQPEAWQPPQRSKNCARCYGIWMTCRVCASRRATACNRARPRRLF